jgi:glycosyltransferase involved in cell wall biosynthesis
VDSHFSVPARRRSGPLRVLTVGTVDLRKGAPYVLETAKRLQGQATFRMVGPIAVSASAQAELRGAVELTGAVPRSEVLAQYAWADVFFLPSLCEGSATATYEALACGLPVVCTPNTGSVVRDGIDGFVVAVRDTAAMAERLRQLHQDRALLESASEQARQRADEFTLEAYRRRLMHALLAGRAA